MAYMLIDSHWRGEETFYFRIGVFFLVYWLYKENKIIQHVSCLKQPDYIVEAIMSLEGIYIVGRRVLSILIIKFSSE